MNYENFDLNLLKIFVCVYENGGIVVASKKLFISQPAVTMSIKKLEIAVGAKLFLRMPKGIKPTKAGEMFYDYAKKALKQIELAIDSAKQFDEKCGGHLSIGASHDLIKHFVMPKVVEFAKKYPNITINFVETIPKHLEKYVERGDIDIVFLEDKKLNNSFECIEVESFENCFFAVKNQNKKFDINCDDLAIFKHNTANFASFEQIFAKIQTKEPKFLVANFDTMQTLVDQNLCIGFAPKKYVDTKKYQIADFGIDILPTKINMCFLKDEQSFLSREFLKLFE